MPQSLDTAVRNCLRSDPLGRTAQYIAYESSFPQAPKILSPRGAQVSTAVVRRTRPNEAQSTEAVNLKRAMQESIVASGSSALIYRTIYNSQCRAGALENQRTDRDRHIRRDRGVRCRSD